MDSTNPPPLDLDAPAAEAARLAARVTEQQLDLPTPCGYPVSVLLAHLLGLSEAFTDAARKIDGPTTRSGPDPTVSDLPAGWRDELAARLRELVTAWREPEAWTGTTLAGGVRLPAETMGFVANNELVLHGWDLAVATGQHLDVAETNLAASWQLVSGTPDDPSVREGLFGPVVPVSEDAPLLDRTLGGAGRNPSWQPEGS